jgi:hypothetical protein
MSEWPQVEAWLNAHAGAIAVGFFAVLFVACVWAILGRWDE